MNKTGMYGLILIMVTGCTAQVQPQTPPPSDSPCLDALRASAGSAYEATKEKVKESQEDGILKSAGDKLDELKERAGKAYDAFLED